MEQLSKIKIVDWILLAIEYVILRFLRLIWIPPIPEEQNIEKKVVVITGANTGLGKATAMKMIEKGATVVFACRNLVEGQKAIDEIKTQTGAAKDKMILMKLDLADLNSIQEFSTALHKKFNAIDILINNAGLIVTTEHEVTKDGFEIHMGVNHFGPFLLTNLLLDILKKGTQSRVVTVASHLIFKANLDVNDLMLEKTNFADILRKDNYLPYNNSKFANILFNLELSNKLEGSGVTCYAICPGLVATDVFRNMSWISRMLMKIQLLMIGVTPEMGCEATLYCALSNKCKNQSGKIFHYNKELSLANKMLLDPKSKQMAKELWERSEKLVDFRTRSK